ncbi:MAG: peptide-methionine (S)-S-oxide reductase, partial [Acidobacteriota bacterium]
MLSTRVGYAGGERSDATYHDLGAHREAVEVTFDPDRISYEELLDVFWSGQPIDLPPDPNPRVHLAVMPRGARQLASAEAGLARLRRERRASIHVDVVTEPRFVAAETVHQKFYLQRGRPTLVDELAADFPDRDAFLASTA